MLPFDTKYLLNPVKIIYRLMQILRSFAIIFVVFVTMSVSLGSMCCSNSSSGKASKKVEEEEKLLKLFQGANKNQDGFMQWCEQTLHTLNTANNLDGESLTRS